MLNTFTSVFAIIHVWASFCFCLHAQPFCLEGDCYDGAEHFLNTGKFLVYLCHNRLVCACYCVTLVNLN